MKRGTARPTQVWLPVAVALLLAIGGAARLAAVPLERPGLDLIGLAVWYGGLIAGGALIVARTMREVASGHFGGDVVAALAIVTAVLLGQPFAGLVIVLMQSGGEALEAYAEGRASAAVRELEAAAPRIAHRLVRGRTEDVAAEAVVVGDQLLVRPGELVPCDSEVIEGRSAVDKSRLTGEPLPVDAAPGTLLPSGSVNGAGSLTVRARARASESQYARIVQLVRSAQSRKAPLQRLADRYAVWFTPLTLVVCAAAWLASGDPTRVLAVLVVATPCPLILATPVAIIGGINRAARRQIVVRHGGALEQLGTAEVVVFDKTGTLTVGQPRVASFEVVDGDPGRVLRLAAAVENASSHLLARSFVTYAEGRMHGDPLPAATSVMEAAGRGVSGIVEGREVSVGSAAFVRDTSPALAPALAAVEARVKSEPGVRAYVVVDGRLAAVLQYADRIRDEAPRVVQELRALGIGRTILLSGDGEANVRAVANTLGIDDARSNLTPGKKAEIVTDLTRSGRRVVMIGDGTNDAPAMASATVGIALAAHGGGITAEAAGLILLADDLGRVTEAIQVSRRTMRIARQSIGVGLGLSAGAMVLAAVGWITPVPGALIQEAIDVAVILNALRTSR